MWGPFLPPGSVIMHPACSESAVKGFDFFVSLSLSFWYFHSTVSASLAFRKFCLLSRLALPLSFLSIGPGYIFLIQLVRFNDFKVEKTGTRMG